MLVLYKSLKKYNQFQLTKKQNGLEYSKIKNHPPSPKRVVTSVTDPLGKTVEETGDSLSLPNLITIIINKYDNLL